MLSSAIDAGRDIAYGEGSIAVWWLWVRSYMGYVQPSYVSGGGGGALLPDWLELVSDNEISITER